MLRIRDVARAAQILPKRELARTLVRAPVVAEAESRLETLPRIELTDLVGPLKVRISLAPADSRHAWSLGVAEQFALQALVQAFKVTSVFEIGTFNGGTTRVLAEALPEGGRVVTLDLPPADFDATQTPDSFTGADVGRAYQDSASSAKVTQLLEDSLRFDPTPYEGQFGLVLVDGGHEYDHGIADTATALRLVAPGGLIVWDDFEPYWHGLVRGITEGMAGRRLTRLAGTALGVYVAD